MPIETVGVRAVVEKLDQYLAGVNNMNTRTDQLITTVERLAASSAKTNALLNQTAQAYQRKATASTQAKKADEEHVSVLQKIENQLKRNLSASVQFSGAFLIIKAQQAIFEGLSEAIVGMNARLEQASIAFTTMLGSAKGAATFLGELQQFAAATPFEFAGLTEATQKLLAYQFTAKQVIPVLRAVGDAAAALGSGQQGIDRIVVALGQMQAKGRVTGEELRQLAEAGIPGLKILADELHITTAEVQKLVTAGQISSTTFIQAFQKFSQLNFGGLMEKQEQTFSGSINTIKDQLLLLSAEGFLPLFKSIRDVTVAFGNFLKGSDANSIAKNLAVAFQFFTNSVKFLLPALTALVAQFVILRAVTIGSKLLDFFEGMALSFLRASGGTIGFTATMRSLGSSLVATLGPVGALVAAFTVLDLVLAATTGRGITARILGVGEAASKASGEVERLQKLFDAISEAGLSRPETAAIVSPQAASLLSQYVDDVHRATEAQIAFTASLDPTNKKVFELVQRLGFIQDPLHESSRNLQEMSSFLKSSTTTAEQLENAIRRFPNLEETLRPEVVARLAKEQQTAAALQQKNNDQVISDLQRTGEAFQKLDTFISDSLKNGEEWSVSLAQVISQAAGTIQPNLEKFDEAFSKLLVSDKTREDIQKFLEDAFEGVGVDKVKKFWQDLTKEFEQGRKNVLGAMQNLIPESDELFSEWLARLEDTGRQLANFSNNLRFVFQTLSQAGISGAADFIRALQAAGPAVTEGVAGMIAIDPKAAIEKFRPVSENIAGAMSARLADDVIAGKATAQEQIGDAVSDVVTAAIARAEDPIFQRIKQLSTDMMKAAVGAAKTAATGAQMAIESEFQFIASTRPDLFQPLDLNPSQTAPETKKPTGTETPGALDRLAKEAEKAQRDAEAAANKAQRDAEKAQREAEQAARDVAQAFEAELEIRLRTVAQATSEDFSRFFNLFVAGFTTQAAEVFDRLPESVQRLTVQLTLAEQAERQFNDSLFELQNFQNISVFGTITNQILDFQSVLDGFFSKIEKSSRAAQQVGGFQKLGQLAAQAYATGLINASGAAGEAAKRIVEAVKAEFEASVKVFDNLANAIVDAIKKRNQKEEDAQLDALNKSKDAFKDETEAKKKAIDDQLQARLDGLDAEKSALKDFTDAAKKQIEAEKDARIEALDAAKRTADNAPAPDFSTTGSEKAINAQAQAFVDASNARIAALQREKQAIDDLAAARDQDKKIQEAQAKIDTLNRVLQGGVSAGARRFLVRQIKEQQKTIDEAQTQRQQKAADDAAKKAIDDKIAAEQALQKQRQDAAQAEIEHVKAIAEAQKKFYEDQKKANDQSIENEKKRIEKKAQAEKDAIEAAAKAEEKKIKDQEEAERKAAAARKDQLDKDLKDTTTNIDNNIAAIRKFFDEVVNSSANINQQVLDIIQGGKVGEIAQLFTDAGITPFQLSGLTLGQAFFTGFFNKDQSLDATVTANIVAIRTGAANTEAILSGGALSTSLTDGATAALPAGFDTMTNSTIAELDSLRDQANPVATDHGTEVGISFVDGMINGVTVRTPALEQAIRDAVAKGVAAAQATIQSHSPSRVTERLVGLPFSQGIAVGILRGGRDIERAAQQVVRIAPGIGQPGGALVASPSMVQAQGMATSMAALANGGGVAQAPVVQEIHNHNWTIQAWDSTDVRRNMSKILREFDQGARRGKTGPIGG